MEKKVYTLKSCDGIHGVYTNIKRVFKESLIPDCGTPIIRVWKDNSQTELISKPSTYNLVCKELKSFGQTSIEFVNKYDETQSAIEIEMHILNQ